MGGGEREGGNTKAPLVAGLCAVLFSCPRQLRTHRKLLHGFSSSADHPQTKERASAECLSAHCLSSAGSRSQGDAATSRQPGSSTKDPGPIARRPATSVGSVSADPVQCPPSQR